MQMTSLELYATTKLNCGVADLSMLDELYSTLGDEVTDSDRLVEECDDLNELLYELYSDVTASVTTKIADWINNHDDIIDDLMCEKFGDEVEVSGDIWDELAEYLEDKNSDFEMSSPYCNCLDTHFQNELDQFIDWDNSAEENAKEVVKYWINDFELPEPEELEIEDEDEE